MTETSKNAPAPVFHSCGCGHAAAEHGHDHSTEAAHECCGGSESAKSGGGCCQEADAQADVPASGRRSRGLWSSLLGLVR